MGSSMKTILYLTDNTLDPAIADVCQKILVREAKGMPIVSVSQKPIDFGPNVCVGEIGRSWLSLYKQIIAGLEAVKTEFIGIAEHDCLYTSEHLSWTPTDSGVFYYNTNCWLVQWGGNHPELNGMYSFWHVFPPRIALSQLVCSKDILLRSTQEVLELLNMGLETPKGKRWFGEPGCNNDEFHKAFVEASSGRSTQLQRYLKEYVTKWKNKRFTTKNPNLDIRHSTNFSGPKRGNMRRYELEPWGKFGEVMANA
jgi:hypothetical protein